MGRIKTSKIENNNSRVISKMKRITKIIIESLSLIICLFLITCFGLSIQNCEKTEEVIGDFFWSLVPNSHLYFTKVNSSRPACKIAQIKGDITNFKFLNVYTAYDEHNIYLYDSYYLDNIVRTIPVDGSVKSVSCYLNSGIHKAEGLYINCLYSKDCKNKLSCYFIPDDAFGMYQYTVTSTKDRVSDYIKNYAKDDSTLKILFPNSQKQVTNGIILHPGLVAEKIINFELGNMEFLGLCFDESGATNIIAKDCPSQSLVIVNDKGRIKVQYKIGHSFAAYVNYYISYPDAYVFDGTNYIHLIASDEVFTCLLKTPVDNGTFSNARFVPSSDDDFSLIYDPVIINNGKIIQIEEYKEYENPKMFKVLDIPSNAKFKYFDCYDLDGSSYIYDFEYNNTKKIDYKIVNRMFSYDAPKYTSEMYTDIFSNFISLCIDKSNNGIVLFHIKNEVHIVDTLCIKEPVDEAHVTYEDNKLTIYFMNKNSIYRWQNSQGGIDNLKFRKLDIEPEPIKTN